MAGIIGTDGVLSRTSPCGDVEILQQNELNLLSNLNLGVVN